MKANPQANKPPPICLNCALCVVPPGWTPEAAQIPNNLLDTPRCRISHMMDVVSGALFYPPCVDMRNPGGPCKFEGVLFVKKDKAQKPESKWIDGGENSNVKFPAWFWADNGNGQWGVATTSDGNFPSKWTHWMPKTGDVAPTKPEVAGLDSAHPGAERSVEPDKTELN